MTWFYDTHCFTLVNTDHLSSIYCLRCSPSQFLFFSLSANYERQLIHVTNSQESADRYFSELVEQLKAEPLNQSTLHHEI